MLLSCNIIRSSNSYDRFVRESIVHASRQIVSGSLYRAEVKMVVTDCRNNDDNTNKGIDECPASDSGAFRMCKFSIWSQPWKPVKIQITRSDCTIN